MGSRVYDEYIPPSKRQLHLEALKKKSFFYRLLICCCQPPVVSTIKETPIVYIPTQPPDYSMCW